jgi:Uri superfamily endonuclease
LVESYRNENDRICQTSLLNIGFITYEIETLNAIRSLLVNRLNRTERLFETSDQEAIHWAEIYWQQLVKTGKVAVFEKALEKKISREVQQSCSTIQMSSREVQ